jgi:PadR family transcriptional regulator, regulatory protein PadR
VASILDRVQGSLDMMILKTLMNGTMHGWGIAHNIRGRSNDVLQVNQGALYPALHRLEVKGLLLSEWGLSDNNRRAKYYRLSAAGRKQLTAETERWQRVAGAVARVLGTA